MHHMLLKEGGKGEGETYRDRGHLVLYRSLRISCALSDRTTVSERGVRGSEKGGKEKHDALSDRQSMTFLGCTNT